MDSISVLIRLEAPKALKALAVQWDDSGLAVTFKPKRHRTKHQKIIPYSRLISVQKDKDDRLIVTYYERDVEYVAVTGELSNYRKDMMLVANEETKVWFNPAYAKMDGVIEDGSSRKKLKKIAKRKRERSAW